MTSQRSEDLDALTSRASIAVESRSRREAGPSTPRHRRWRMALLSAVVMGASFVAYQTLSPPSPTAVARDLDAVLEQARASVEASHKATGKLPEALPNAALSAVVRYEPLGDAYRLSASVLGIRLTLEPDGAKQLEHGISP